MPGEVKTRLIPAIGAEAAALLHAALTERALDTASRSGHAVELCCAPDAGHAFFVDCAEQFDCILCDQGPGDLGQRMLRAMQRALVDADRVVVIGADCPALTPQHIKRAVTALADNDVALLPAEDGGYVLIAARRTAPTMFDGIEWGQPAVLVEQRRALQRAGLSCIELETLWDLDRPEDIARLQSLRPPLAFFLPP